MQVLIEARSTLQDCAMTALQPLLVFERQARRLAAEVQGLGGRVSSDLRALAVRAQTSTADLHQQFRDARSIVMGRSGPGAREFQQAFALLEREEQTVVGSLNATSESFATMVSGLDAGAVVLSDELCNVLAGLGGTREKVQSIVNGGTSLLRQLDDQLDQLWREFLEKIEQLEVTFNSAIESIKNAVNTFVEGIRSLVDQFAETINSATSPIMAGADALSGKVTDLLTKASNLIDQIQNIVAAVIGAINKIPVSSLPEPLAKPTVTAISQVSTQFSSQLSNGAKAASTELQGIADKIAGAIEKAETTLTEQLGAAIEPLFAQIDEIVKQIEQKQLEIGQQITKQLESLSARKDELIEAAQSRIDALVKPVPEKIEEYCNQIAQTAASAEQSLRRAIEGCESRVSELAAQFERVSQRISESAQALEAMPAPLLTKLATLKAHAQSTR